MKQTVLFIINPKSGKKRNKQIQELARKHLTDFEVCFKETEYAGHAIEICKEARDSFDVIVAVGGDGTIHEVAQSLIRAKATLGIIPMGSGNGFARSQKIPLRLEKAIIHLKHAKEKTVDTVECNGEYFVNVAGIGFDAEIGFAFDNHKSRGGMSYIPLVLKLLKNYKPVTLNYHCHKKDYTQTAFLASFANSSQWGMNAHIAPHAKTYDGVFDFVMLKPFPLWASAGIAIKLFRKKLHKSKYYEAIQLKNLQISTQDNIVMHFDGEPRKIQGPISFQIHTQSLKILR